MAYRCIRGAITVDNDCRDDILQATKELLSEILECNALTHDDLVSILFSATGDITAVYPAVAARELGLTQAGLMCFQEMYVENSLKKCIRVMVQIDSGRAQSTMQHVYLRGAAKLRPDLVQKAGKRYAITIDGPSGCGKSTTAKVVAKELGFRYVDTGAMYRAAGIFFVNRGIPLNDESAIEGALHEMRMDVRYVNGVQRIFLQDEDVTSQLRTQAGADGASKVGVIQKVREQLVEQQRVIASRYNVVMDGRDIGTVVLPDATLKIFLTASVEARTSRRIKELRRRGAKTNYNTICQEIQERDNRDLNRTQSPLRQAEDAVLLDTSDMTLKQAVSAVLKLFKNRECR